MRRKTEYVPTGFKVYERIESSKKDKNIDFSFSKGPRDHNQSCVTPVQQDENHLEIIQLSCILYITGPDFFITGILHGRDL